MASGAIVTPLTVTRGHSCSLLAISVGADSTSSASASGSSAVGRDSGVTSCTPGASTISSTGGFCPPQPPCPALPPPHPHPMTSSSLMRESLVQVPGLWWAAAAPPPPPPQAVDPQTFPASPPP